MQPMGHEDNQDYKFCATASNGRLMYYGARRRVRAMQRLAWRAAPKFNREEVIQFQRDLKEKIKEEEYRIGEY